MSRCGALVVSVGRATCSISGVPAVIARRARWNRASMSVRHPCHSSNTATGSTFSRFAMRMSTGRPSSRGSTGWCCHRACSIRSGRRSTQPNPCSSMASPATGRPQWRRPSPGSWAVCCSSLTPLRIDGQILVLFDPVYHRPAEAEARLRKCALTRCWIGHVAEYDQRFVLVHRPVVLTGGELSMEQLDLQYDTHTKVYQAPFQMKANGGVLIVDDFGRQRMPPRDMLNRWIVPLEKRIDYLTLHTGSKFPVPFDCLLIMATNIDPKQLVEEAFLRRIHYKIKAESPSPRNTKGSCAATAMPRGSSTLLSGRSRSTATTTRRTRLLHVPVTHATSSTICWISRSTSRSMRRIEP